MREQFAAAERNVLMQQKQVELPPPHPSTYHPPPRLPRPPPAVPRSCHFLWLPCCIPSSTQTTPLLLPY